MGKIQGFNDFTESLNEAKTKCPPATQDIKLNPSEPNKKFWDEKVEEWKLDTVKEAKTALCGNCAAFDISKKTLDCIAKGIGDDEGSENPMDVIEAGDLGYCRFLKFKCAAKRTCDAWVTGGPIK